MWTMRLAPIAVACALVPAVAVADPPRPVSVVGGKSAALGDWPDVAAILFPDDPNDPSLDDTLCTGTLVAPTVVLTAGHCYDPNNPPLPDNVLIGAATLAKPEQGEVIPIKQGFVYPDAENSFDLAVLVLARPSTRTPRKIVDAWARFDVVNGAKVSIVGYGATDAEAMTFVDELQEATTTITDAGCAVSSGCEPATRPDGELAAGGMGIDTCPGDSGGPLYLMAGYGPVLAGVTSRGFDDASLPCSDGGIYVRPDKVLDWIEMVAGVPVARVSGPTADPITAIRGDGGDIRIRVNDPANHSYRFDLVTPPAHGVANLRSDGAVRVCTDAESPASDDQLTVMITDTEHPDRAMSVTVPIHIEDGMPPPRPCDINAFSESGGCCDAGGGSGGAIPLAIGVVALARRRRRARG